MNHYTLHRKVIMIFLDEKNPNVFIIFFFKQWNKYVYMVMYIKRSEECIFLVPENSTSYFYTHPCYLNLNTINVIFQIQ